MANAREGKIVQDPVHGVIHLDPLAVKIIDTKHFQRLRNIKQVSFADYVYPGGTHTRFAHSIGVYHLACKMIKKIDEIEFFPPGAEKMTDSDKKCIRVAALCHDLGHGPFSHIYEHMARKILKDASGKEPEWKHETMSANLVDDMLKLETFNGDFSEEEIDLVKSLIQGKKEVLMKEMEKKKKYMFQIVSNKDSGVDVDKWDYFNRDAMAFGLLERFQYDRVLSLARIVKTDRDTFELGYRDADALNFYNMFNTRFTLFQRILHKVKIAVDLMIRDVFRSVHEENKTFECNSKIVVFPIESTTGRLDDTKLQQYMELSDDILFKIETHEKYQTAKTLLKRIQERNLYKMIIDIPIKNIFQPSPKGRDLKKLAEEEEKKIQQMVNKSKLKIPEDVEIEMVTFDYGSDENDPVSMLYFYRKEAENTGIKLGKDEVSTIIPSVFQEYHLRVYGKLSKEANKKLKQTLEERKAKKTEPARRGRKRQLKVNRQKIPTKATRVEKERPKSYQKYSEASTSTKNQGVMSRSENSIFSFVVKLELLMFTLRVIID